MLWSAGLDAPRHVWVHGWRLVQGGERMSKSRGNFLDPHAVVAAFGADGARYVTLREVAFDRDTEVSWDSFVRRYNADLANDFGNLVNRTHLHGQPVPRRASDPRRATTTHRRLPRVGPSTLKLYREKLDGYLLHDALAELWEFVGGANKTVDAEQPWTIQQGGQGRRRDVGGAAARGCSATLSRPVDWSAWRSRRSCRRWRRASSSSSGITYPYGPDGNGGPDILELLEWGAVKDAGSVTDAPSPLFPRLDVEAAETTEG